jgi:hypothetical protein
MTAAEAQWSPVQNLILGEDPQSPVYAETPLWLKKIRAFRKVEDERMFLREPTREDLAAHKTLLQRLIADGEYLLPLGAQAGLPENVEGATPESLAATVELLRADYRGWHEPMPPEKRDQMLREVFPDVQ